MEYIFKRKPRKCTKCNFIPVGNILYGYPYFEDEKLQEDIACAIIVLGGCCTPVISVSPTRKFLNCGIGVFYEKDYIKIIGN